MSQEVEMTQARACDVLRRIIPWALEANVQKPNYRSNYKGVRGRIGIVGGARDYTGAPYFASISTMRLGADLAYVICSNSASQVIKGYSPDLIVLPLLDCPSDAEFASEMDCLLNRLHTLVIGPGLGRDRLLQERAKTLIGKAKARSLSLVLDADSLILVNEDPAIIRSYPKVLLTPNRIELQRMLNALYAPKTFDLRNMEKEQVAELVKQCSAKLEVSIIAKGPVDICSHPSGFTLETNESSGSQRRCGGQGDILAGLAGCYLHWIEQANRANVEGDKIEHPVVWSAYLAATTTRLCNELAYKEFRQGMLASQMVDKIHIALDKLLNDSSLEEVKNITTLRNFNSAGKYSGLLSADEIGRYARQMIMDEFGPQRQLSLKKASAVIVGAGGLGCPAAIYLGAGGIGRLGIVDHDRVETSNLHRQILHNLEKVGMLKTESIKQAIEAINPNVRIDTHSVQLTRHNAVSLVEDYDIVIDATDNLITRYIISDACVVAKKPLVSGAALKMDGQLTVYNYDEDTPCFRCLFPEPPPGNAVGSCSDNGVLGVIPGIIGVQQALEALKIGAGLRPAYAGKMLLFDGQLGLFRHITLGKRKPDCEACGGGGRKLGRNLIDYDEFAGASSCRVGPSQGGANDILGQNERISVEQYRDILESGKPHVLVDVRPLIHSQVSRFEHALQLPVQEMVAKPEQTRQLLLEKLKSNGGTNQVYVVCRRGIASQRGTRIIQELLGETNATVEVKDISGGMTAWSKEIDSTYNCL